MSDRGGRLVVWMKNALQTTFRESLLILWTSVSSPSPHPGLRQSGIQRGRRFLCSPVGSWQSTSRCWRRTRPGAAPTSPAGCWGCEESPGCSLAPNCRLTEGHRREQIQKRVGKYSSKIYIFFVPILRVTAEGKKKFYLKTCLDKVRIWFRFVKTGIY